MVIVAKKDIAFRDKITLKMLTTKNVAKVKRTCTPIQLKDLEGKVYFAKHLIRKGFIVCTKSLEELKNNSVLFKFGNIEIEKHGTILHENDKYITIKKANGKTEKIYKDGSVK
jgi:hypothetical protein